MVITSLNNNKIKEYIKLKERKNRKKTGEFLIEGRHLVLEACKKGIVKEIILVENASFITDIPVIYVSSDVMNKLSDMESASDVMALCTLLDNEMYGEKFVLLDDIQDPGNLGTLIRSARAFGFNTLILDGCVDPYNPKTLRSAEGNIFFISIVNESLDSLKKKGYEIYSTSMNGISLESENSFPQKLVLILGNEGRGVREEIQEIADKNLTISMIDAESLNVAVAGSIIMHHIMAKQKAE